MRPENAPLGAPPEPETSWNGAAAARQQTGASATDGRSGLGNADPCLWENALRAPLDRLMREGAALGNCSLPPAVRQYAENMLKAASDLAHVVDNPGKSLNQSLIGETRSPFNLQHLVREAHDAVSATAENAGIGLAWYMPPQLGHMYEGQAQALRETLCMLLESAVREDLNDRATRVSAVLNPVKLIITNYPEGQVEEMEAVNNPEHPEEGNHVIEFSRELWMERDDFMEDAPKKYFRMTPGQEVRLKNAYIVKCTGCKKNDAGEITEVYCEYDPDTKSGLPGANRKVKGTIHWVSCAHCLEAEVRLYDRLWKVENPRDELAAIREAKNCDALTAMKEMINPDSLNVLPCCYIEKYAAGMQPLSYLQFQRIGYFNVDKDSTPEKMVFNRTVGLKDVWGKINK